MTEVVVADSLIVLKEKLCTLRPVFVAVLSGPFSFKSTQLLKNTLVVLKNGVMNALRNFFALASAVV